MSVGGTAIERTAQLERIEIPVGDIEPQDINPNAMSDAEFNLLSDNIEQMGITDAILVRRKPAEEVTEDKPAHYRAIGGHHRWEVAKLLGFETVPCTVVDRPDFDQDQEHFQTVRMNVIRGKIVPEKLIALHATLSQKYQDEVLAESFGFTSEAEFKKLIDQTKKQLPKELQKKFAEAAQELKTIDDLSKLLNRLFTTFGDTLPYGYLCFDYGGKDSIWLRMSSPTYKAMQSIGLTCRERSVTMDSVVGGMIRLMADGKLNDQLLQLIADAPKVEIPNGVEMPTDDTVSTT